MTRLEFNMRLNALVTDALEDGFDLGWIADTLKGVSNEILDEDDVNYDGVDGALTTAQINGMKR